jgi:hypothetical protein
MVHEVVDEVCLMERALHTATETDQVVEIVHGEAVDQRMFPVLGARNAITSYCKQHNAARSDKIYQEKI